MGGVWKGDTEYHQDGVDLKRGNPQRRFVRVVVGLAVVAKQDASAEGPSGQVGACGIGQEEEPDEKSGGMGHREGVR